jgi:hypothetical protein
MEYELCEIQDEEDRLQIFALLFLQTSVLVFLVDVFRHIAVCN